MVVDGTLQSLQSRLYMSRDDYISVIFGRSSFLMIVRMVFSVLKRPLIGVGACFITIRYRPEDNPEVPIILRPRHEETMMKWYNTLMDLHQRCMEQEADWQSRGYLEQSSYQRQTQLYPKEGKEKSLSMSSVNGTRSSHSSKFDGRMEISSPVSGSGSDDGGDDTLRSTPISRNASATELASQHQITRKPAPSRFPVNPHGPPPHVRAGSLGVTTDFQGSYFSPMVDTPPVPVLNGQAFQQYPFPIQHDAPMARTLSKDGYATNGIPTPPLTAKLPERSSRPSVPPLNTARSRSASTPNIHQIQTNLGSRRDLPPPLPVSRHEQHDGNRSPVTPHSPGSPMTTSSRPTTGTSTFNTNFSSIPETPSSMSSTSTTSTRRPVPSTPSSISGDKSSALKVKITFNNDIFVIVVPTDVNYATLVQKVRHKLLRCSNVPKDGPLRMKYQDEDGDLVTISSDEDVALAVESRHQHNNIAAAGFAGAGVINLLVQSTAI